MDQHLIKPENPAKAFLRKYRALVKRQDSIQRAIDAAYDRAYSSTRQLRSVRVQGGGAYDRMAEDVARIADETDLLEEERKRVVAALVDVLRAINSVRDEMLKTVLTLRYIEGMDWLAIAEKIGYEATQTYVLHGRALYEVNIWLKANGLA